MSDQIKQLACDLSEASNELAVKRRDYKVALANYESMKKNLTDALDDRESRRESIAITLDDHEILLCIWDELDSYEFSIIRLYN